MAKKQHYNITNLLATKAQYMMLLGQRANGKSYQVKETLLKEVYNKKRYFVYLRRWSADIKQKAVLAYFDDMPISAYTKGMWDRIAVRSNEIFFARTDENGKEIKSDAIGRYCALNENERYKSWAFVDYDYIVYEEFITDKIYLYDEPRILQQFVSTVARDRQITVFMVGNTLSRVCPYFSEWCLDGVLKQKQGTIEIYHHHIDEITTIDIAVENCAAIKTKNKMFFGQSAKQIISGEWDTVDVPKLPKKLYEYAKIYEVLIKYQSFSFVMELLMEPEYGGLICYVYPYTKNREIPRLITNVFSDRPNITTKLDISRKAEARMIDCIRLEKVCFSDNLTGSDFRNVVANFKFY